MSKMRFNKTRFMNNVGKKIIVVGMVGLIGFTVMYGVNKLFFDKGTVTQQLIKQKDKAESTGMSKDLDDIISDEIVMNNIHWMTNTKIVAEDNQIWGKKTMTNEEIDVCINYLESDDNLYNRVDVGAMVKYLKEWKDGDYSHAVELHNMAWDYVGGTIGRAVKLK